MPRKMTSDELREVATVLLGKQWQNELARRIGVGDRTVRGWASGDADIPGHVSYTLLGLVEIRHTELDQVAAKLRPIAETSPIVEALTTGRAPRDS